MIPSLRRRRSTPTRFTATSAVALTVVILSACSLNNTDTTGGDNTSPAAQTRPACTSSESFSQPLATLTPATDPRVGQGPCTTRLPERGSVAAVSPGTQTLPTTVTSHDPTGGVDVTVTDTSRIVAFDISGSIGQTIFALGYGKNLVGRDVATSFPDTSDIPIVTGSSHSINIESVIALDPSLVITDGSIGPLDVVLQLRDAGIPLVFVDSTPSITGSVEKAQQVALALGDPEAGEELSTKLNADINQVISDIQALAPQNPEDRVRIAFLYVRGSASVYYLFGQGSGADDLIRALNGVDVASEIGWVGEKPMTDEALIEANPDLLLLMTKGLDSVGGPEGLTKTLQSTALTNAGKNLNIIDMTDSQIMTFGPRTAEVLDALARAIYSRDAATE
ncbi:ABC transporter substrate-binding protein [Lysinibacter sp. HNR]|uniref:heme/hemin ABC transporter substrate-binding protein n=1 Tax=Lysinibacter sp. HNR TaxID=3031408 RepID=UPI002435371E|nr:ABC transporter substrate-binding protein [Lysinibacter sp. HNR]WGD36997.1 ABC transporter substrate-binding protein [Lysinibacter sp. HNR]